jgi:hypothetical protein
VAAAVVTSATTPSPAAKAEPAAPHADATPPDISAAIDEALSTPR